jgi:hypothetical protein
MPAAAAAFVWTPQDVNLLWGYRVEAQAASWVWSAQDVLFPRTWRLVPEAAEWIWDAQATGQINVYTMPADGTSWVWEGMDVEYSISTSYDWNIAPGVVGSWATASARVNGWTGAANVNGTWSLDNAIE